METISWDAFKERKDIEHFAKGSVPSSEVAEEEYNLSVSTYVGTGGHQRKD
ncbi:MAG: N-6 DNA methylase [Synergistaceae bacterium]